ncbi:hypothetical protein [Nocardia macrotermitis]|uniref:Uncharacterized protein n=1 Tax=Nocardia macrotermitis TaxID=2585198 RepID=A0A7K0D084_9NOCA|nr:hypothetical protein [Nocardia macrotermitis]MQY19137.1 hypothetical protein [Nocardia macrotermitis]
MKKSAAIAVMSLAIAAFSAGVGDAATVAGIDLGPIPSGSGQGNQTPPDSSTPPAPPNGQHVGGDCRAGGNKPGHWNWVHLDGSAAEHYGTHWMWVCQ